MKSVSKRLNAEVSDDIINEIFLRLPAKSLLRFRSISKIWHDIIDNHPPFAIMHMSTQVSAAATAEPQILPLSYSRGYKKTQHSFIYEGNEIKQSQHPILEFSEEVYVKYTVQLVDCGLLLFQNQDNLFLCNPLRGEVLELPPPLPVPSEVTARYGIGFDSTIRSYKIVRVGRELSELRKVQIEVYTLGSPSWRVICPPESFSLKPVYPFDGLSAFGVIHWRKWDSRRKKACIISFDVKDEEFKETPLPDFGCPRKHLRQFKLTNLKGFLAVVSFPSSAHLEIWMLKDYQKKEWIREYKISTQVWERGPYKWARGPYNIPPRKADMRFWVSDDMGACSQGLVFPDSFGRCMLVDLQNKCIWDMKLPEGYNNESDRTFSYTGSILSLRNFGNPIAEIPHKYRFLKTARTVYASP